jgi:DNA-binding HxlR family transcriptional regulator
VAAVDVEFCPYFQDAVELIGRRWCGPITRSLLAGPLRFSGLERALPGISARALTQRLRELEEAGVVARVVEPARPVRVSYELTAKGRALDEVVEAIEGWAHEWLAPAEHAHARAS